MKRLYPFYFSLVLFSLLLTFLPLKIRGERLQPVPVTPSSSIEEIRAQLQQLDLPLLEFTLQDGKFPSYEIVLPPEDCGGVSITDNEYVEGRFTISLKGKTLYDSGEYQSKKSGVRVKVRGNTSTVEFNKKSYKVKLSKKADLLLREGDDAKDKDWVLLGPGSGKLNYMAGSEIGRLCGLPWEPQGRHVVVIMNNRYMGVFYLVEAVSAGEHRVDIEESGYIVENDPYWWKPDEVYFKTNRQQADLGWTFKEPDTDDFHEMSVENIRFVLNTAEHRLYTSGEASDMIDYDSFARWMLAHDIMNSSDGYGSNIFVQKKDFSPFAPFSSKLCMGPLWDFDSAFEDTTPEHAVISSLPGFWFHILFKDPQFLETYEKVWKEVRETFKDKLLDRLDRYAMENEDLYKAREIDLVFDLNCNQPLTHPVDDSTEISRWLNWRIPVLDKLILGISGVEEPETSGNLSGDGSAGVEGSYTLSGLPADNESQGVVVNVYSDGKVSKSIR